VKKWWLNQKKYPVSSGGSLEAILLKHGFQKYEVLLVTTQADGASLEEQR